MKIIVILLFSMSIVLNSFTKSNNTASKIIGSATPSDAIKKIAAFDGKDSVFTNTSTGTFAIEVHAGNWKLIVLALPPYKDAALENVIVQEGQDTDVGEIKLSQK